MKILDDAKRENERLEREMKKHYNAILKRIKDGEEYFRVNGYDKNFPAYLGLIEQANAILKGLPHWTNEEFEDGFIIEEEKNEGET